MNTAAWIILGHQAIFQTMFVAKNIALARRTGQRIRGKNREVRVGIAVFALFILASGRMAIIDSPVGTVHLIRRRAALAVGLGLLGLNLAVAAASLAHLTDSWRIGIPTDQKTTWITTGIYRFTRNPYFLSYLLMFFAYAVILQNGILLGLAAIAFFPIHKMIRVEERFLLALHGGRYSAYMQQVPRYLLI